MSRRIRDLTGQRFGSLTVVRIAGRDKIGRMMWLCSCDCGTQAIKAGYHLVQGRMRSCGHRHKCGTTATRGFSYLTLRWRAAVLQAADSRCDCCGGAATTAHHLYGRTEFPEKQYDLNNGVALCLTDHKTFHRWQRRHFLPVSKSVYFRWKVRHQSGLFGEFRQSQPLLIRCINSSTASRRSHG